MVLDEDDGPPVSIAAGITIGLIASLIQSLGITIQRKSHVLNQQKPFEDQVVEHKRPLWLLGFIIFISSNILGSLFQIAALPVLILAPLGAVSLLWNAFFARFILGDVFSIWLVLGTILIAGGAVLIAIFGIVPEPAHSLDRLLELFGRPAFITYFTLLGAAVFGLLVVTHIAEISLRRRLRFTPPPTPPEMMTPERTNSPIPGETTERTPLLGPNGNTHSDPKHPPPPPNAPNHTRLLLAVSYSSASGIISGMCLLFAKSGVELLLLTLSGENQFHRWESWMLLFGLVVFALLQLWYLHKSLILADPTLVCPLAFCFYNVSSILNGLVYYDQFAALSTRNLWLVLLGTGVLLGGVWSVSIQAGQHNGVDVGTFHEGERTAEEMQGLGLDLGEEQPSLARTRSLPPRLPSDIKRAKSHRRSVTTPAALDSVTEVDESAISGTASPVLLDLQVQEASDDEEDLERGRPTPQHPLSQSETLPFPSQTTSSTLRPPHRRRRRYTLLSGTGTTQNTSTSQTLRLGLPAFSIGLSPISPGFAVVPQRTIRMTLPGVVGQVRMRRTLSEGDVRNRPDGVVGEAASSVDGGGQEPPIEEGRKMAKDRWKWIRGLVRGGGPQE